MKSELDKLTRKDIQDIRRKFNERMYVILTELARRYNIDHDLIWQLVLRFNTRNPGEVGNELDKLTSNDIEVILDKFHTRKNVIIVELAKEYGVTHNLIWQLVIWPFIDRYRLKRNPE